MRNIRGGTTTQGGEKSRFAVGPASSSNRLGSMGQGQQRKFAVVPKMGPRVTSGLGNLDFSRGRSGPPLGVGDAFAKGGKTAFHCVEEGCMQVVTSGPGGNAYYKPGNVGPFCAKHWADEFVQHAPQMSAGNAPDCVFGARYTEAQDVEMQGVISQMRDVWLPRIAASGAAPPPFTYALITAEFKRRPALRNEQKCPNCGTVVVWWPDPKSVYGNIAGVVG